MQDAIEMARDAIGLKEFQCRIMERQYHYRLIIGKLIPIKEHLLKKVKVKSQKSLVDIDF